MTRTAFVLPALYAKRPPVVQDFYANGGRDAVIVRELHELEDFDILCIPSSLDAEEWSATYSAAATFCGEKRAMLIVDPPRGGVPDPAKIVTSYPQNVALYYPSIGRPPSGAIAGVWVRMEEQRGVWKAPAGLEATLQGVSVATTLTDAEIAALTERRINCLRAMPDAVLWGARALDGFISVRRLTLFIEKSVLRGQQPSVLLDKLFRQGAFAGRKAEEAYFVRGDSIGFAPLRPSEFVILRIES